MNKDKNGFEVCWHRIPKCFVAVAKDENGKVFAFNEVPIIESDYYWQTLNDDEFGNSTRILFLNEEYVDPNDIDWKDSLCLRSEWEEEIFAGCEPRDFIFMKPTGEWCRGYNHDKSHLFPIENMCPEWKHSEIVYHKPDTSKTDTKEEDTILSIDMRELGTIISETVMACLIELSQGKKE